MSVLNRFVSKDNAVENSSPPTNESAEKSVLPPFSGKLSVDEKLKLTNDKFEQTIHDSFKDKSITPLSQLTATPPFPTPYVIAQLASKAYKDYKKRETDAQYETRLALPDGWKLLTTGSNSGKSNGYFGAAYWRPEHQQVVIAHRGTGPTKFGALWIDVVGVVFKYHVPQMSSASTFAYNVVEVLKLINQEKGVQFQVFFTGHSLGGWLAQITNFTTKYLDRKGITFLRSENVSQRFHPHTVVFDSPGCKDMLSQMADELDVLYDGRSIDIEHLDITNYLSAPNRINTCNSHLGTVYRIFTDLSDMGWRGKSTALFNLAKHSMDKIVEAFDPETGQVLEDEQGKLQIQVVVYWPVTDGLFCDNNYESFFKWTKDFNNYHPEVTDKTLPLKGYHLLRYQTKTYDERVSSVSIFSHDERHFLENYCQLSQLPEFFKPKELFSAMEGNQAQEAEKILQSFKIKNQTIHCTDASALRALIPYVKRLLQLFPQIKETTKCALSPNEIGNNVYQIGTKHYLETFQQSQIKFIPDALTLTDFLNSEQEKILQLRMVDGDAWTGLIKVYQVLKKTLSITDRLSKGHYTILTLEHLLLVNRIVNLNTLLESTTAPHLLVMSCEIRYLFNDETKQILRSLFNTLKKNQCVKIVLTTQSENDTTNFLQDLAKETSSDRIVTRDVELTWCDLTTYTQEELLEKPIKFQGARIFLKELISAESPVAKFMSLGALLEEKELMIADPVPISNGYSEDYYIGRTLCRQKAIKQDIFNDKSVRDSHVYLARTEEEYTILCQLYPKSIVHWVENDKSGMLVWQQSQGSLETVRRYIDTESSHTYTADDLDKLLEQAQKQRVMLISDTAGMGKSTVLTHLSKRIKEKFPGKWVVRIGLNNHTDALKSLKQEQIDKQKAIEFVSEKVLKLKPGLELELFKQCCEQIQKVRIVIMLDGFDEISPSYEETVCDLLQALRQTAVEQLWVTTRPHLRNELEDKLQQLSYTLEPLSENDQVEFLIKFWTLQDWFTEREEKGKEIEKNSLEVYAKHLIKILAESIHGTERDFTGIPLHSHMLAEVFDEEVKTFSQYAESMPNSQFHLDLLDLYGLFIQRKYDIYHKEKLQVPVISAFGKEQRERELMLMRKDNQVLALMVLFTEEQVTLFQNNIETFLSNEELTRIGIVQLSHEGKPHFIHRKFAEYYVADYLVNCLREGNNTSEQVLSFILKDIFLKNDYRVIRVFMDGLFPSSKPSDEVLKQCGNRIYDLGNDCMLILHQAIVECNVNIIGILSDSLQAAERTDTFIHLLLAENYVRGSAWNMATEMGNLQVLEKLWECANEKLKTAEINDKLLLAGYKWRRTPFHMAADQGRLEVLKKVWDWANEKLTTEEINNKLLLATDGDGRTVFHNAAEGGRLGMLQKVWEWANEKLKTEEIINKLLLAKGYKGRTVFHMAANQGSLEILKKVWEWANEKLTTEEINNKLLLATDDEGRTVFHMAADQGRLEMLQKVWEWANEKQTTEEINNKLLLATDCMERTPFHMAADQGRLEILEKVWVWANEKLTTEDINNKLLLATDEWRRTVLHMACYQGRLEILEKVWEWANEKLTTEEINNKLLLATDEWRRTALHMATYQGTLELLQKLWEWANEKLTTEEINNKLLLATNEWRTTVFHMAASHGRLEMLKKVWEWANEKITTEEINNEFLLATDNMGRTVFHIAADQDGLEILQKVWEWAEEKLTTEEINNKLFATDYEGRTVFYIAAEKGELEKLQEVWLWANEKLTTEEINNKLLLATDYMERTPFHMAADQGRLEILEKVWEWANEKLTTEEINNNLLLATDDQGRTIFHMAAYQGSQEILQKVWGWANDKLTTEEINNKLLLARSYIGRTVFHIAADQGRLEMLEKILESANEKLTTEEINNKLLLATDNGEKLSYGCKGCET